MKIAHVLPALTKGGGERVAAELANYAIRAGHEVTLIVGRPTDATLLRDALNPHVHVLYVANAPVSKFMNYCYLLPWLIRHRVWISELDILHCHLTFGAVFGTVVQIWRKVSGSHHPTVLETYHSVGAPISTLHLWFRAAMIARLDALALMAEDDYWCAFVKHRPKLLSSVILNGISDPGPIKDREQLRCVYRSELGIPDKCRFVVGTVGRLAPDRKPWLFMPIFAQIARVLGSDVHFVLAGGGPEYDHMRSLAEENGLDGQVHLPGLILDPRRPLAVMDLYVTLNAGPVTGLAALEAAYLGLPILAIQLLDSYQARPDDWIWSSTDLSAIAERAINLLRSPQNRQALAETQSAYVRGHHTVDAMGESYEEFYLAAIERRSVFLAKGNGALNRR